MRHIVAVSTLASFLPSHFLLCFVLLQCEDSHQRCILFAVICYASICFFRVRRVWGKRGICPQLSRPQGGVRRLLAISRFFIVLVNEDILPCACSV